MRVNSPRRSLGQDFAHYLSATVAAVDLAKEAVTVLTLESLTLQVLVAPVQAPDQALNLDPLLALAVRVTVELAGKRAEQVEPQDTASGALVTAPLPPPAILTVKTLPVAKLNTARVDLLEDPRVNSHKGLVPVQAPVQYPKT
jgi:hypothetical protein